MTGVAAGLGDPPTDSVSFPQGVNVRRAKDARAAGWRLRYRKELLERIAADGLTQEAMEALRTTEGWQRWLRVRSHLATHGLHNQILVAHQRPAARRIRSSKGWKSAGYEVTDREKPIRVWGHVPPVKAAGREWKRAGSASEQQPEGELRLVSVFDQDQVTPTPESSAVTTVTRSTESRKLICLLGQLLKFASEIAVPVTFEPITGTVRGYHEPSTDRIVIDASADFPPAARARRLIYELANVLIDEDPRRRGLRLGNGEREVVTLSVTQCVCACAGWTSGSEAPIAVPPEWEFDRAVLAVSYAALVDRVAARLEAGLVAGLDAETSRSMWGDR
jgi:hypothetical protein